MSLNPQGLPACFLLLASLFAAELIGIPDEEYVEPREFTSPVTKETFIAYVLKEEPPVASYDYDRCPHPPVNSLAYALVIDPASGYVAYPESFNAPSPWDLDDLAQILGEPGFERSTPEGLPWAGAYPWEKFENAAKLAEAADLSAQHISQWWLLAAWSVRLDVISGHNEFDSQVAELFEQLPLRGPDPAELGTLYELQLTAEWQELRSTGQLPGVPDAELDLALAWLYRSRGELVAAESWLDRAALSDSALPERYTLYRYLRSSIRLEQSYLRVCEQWLGNAWNGGEVITAEQGGVAYLLGEISRRLGDFSKAFSWYERAGTMNRGALSPELIERQLALVRDGRGY